VGSGSGRLFEAHGDLGRKRLLGRAAEIGLELSSFAAHLDNGLYRGQVHEDFRMAVRHETKSPLTLFSNGIVYEGPRTADALAGLIGKLGTCA
jgi:predicted DsbA family dithiol-disulfide isomerase